MQDSRDAWIMIAAVLAYFVAAGVLDYLFLADAFGTELADMLILFVGVFAIAGAEKVPDLLRGWAIIRPRT